MNTVQMRCKGKVAHPSETRARKARQRSRGKERLQVYRCDYCKQYHLGEKMC